MDYLAVACRCLIGVVFVVSAFGKVRSRQAFREFVTSTAALVPRRGRALSPVVVAAELAVPVLLAVPVTVRTGFGLAAVLLAAFAVAIAAAVRRGVRTSCRCFGASTAPLGTRHVVRNAGLFAVAAVGALLGPGRPAELAGVAIAAIAAVVLAALVTRLDDLVELFAPMPTSGGRSSR
jgi:uncharacterized membrane protein YphA (DoxX/SURF4 family)